MRVEALSRPMIVLLLAVVAGAAIAVALIGGATSEGADHADAPGVLGDPAADINDVYAFRSPDNLVVALTVNPLTAPGALADFAEDVAYEIHVDNSGDFVADATVSVTFSGGEFTLSIAALGLEMSGPVTASGSATPVITDAGGIRGFAGPRDDPFFFDLGAFLSIVAEPFVPANGLRGAGDTPSDALAGTNVSAIVIEAPIVALTGADTSDTGVIRAWATTSRDGARVDRMAIPALNTAVVPSGAKDAYNAGDPVDDETAFLAAATDSVQGLRDAFDAVLGDQDGGPLGDLSAGDIADFVLPDVVTIDFSQPVAFPAGRALDTDVVDIALGLVLNRGGAAGVSDGIASNDVAFLSSFPFLAAPHQAVTALPASGSGGLADGAGGPAAWAIALVAALGAVAFVGVARLAVKRSSS